MGADYIATGHYARVEHLPGGRYTLRECALTGKDQTYALYNLTQDQLSRTLMPLGDYTKEQVRKIAEEIGLSVADKPDSQEICFIPDHDYAGFIARETEGRVPPEGNFVTSDGRILGRHKGITHYTIGQRKGLGVALGFPVFVTEIRPETNEVVLGSNEEVFGNTLCASQLNFMSIPMLKKEMEVIAKIRYNDKGKPCKIHMQDEQTVVCQFHEPVRAITPGQAVVFYDGEIVAGGGTILKARRNSS